MKKPVAVELREHNKKWFEIKVWIKNDNNDLINFTECESENEISAKILAAYYVTSHIMEGSEEVKFYHTKQTENGTKPIYYGAD